VLKRGIEIGLADAVRCRSINAGNGVTRYGSSRVIFGVIAGDRLNPFVSEVKRDGVNEPGELLQGHRFVSGDVDAMDSRPAWDLDFNDAFRVLRQRRGVRKVSHGVTSAALSVFPATV
jgi:hypothetical protein